MSAASALIGALAEWQVRHVFCCPGTSEIPVLDAIVELRGEAHVPEFILTTHEAIAVSMADGYARASGDIGVAYLHTNVGVANGLAHLYAAQVARSRVAVLAGIKGTATLPHRALTTSPRLLETAAPYAGHVWQNLRPEDLLDDVSRMLWSTGVVPEQPAVLTVPQNHLMSEAGGAGHVHVRSSARQSPDPDAVREAADLLRHARHPVIVAGSDVARRGAESALERLAERAGAPVLVESRRDLERWSFRTDHPAFAGLFEPSAPLLADCDLLVLAGMPTPLEFSSERPSVPPGVPILHVAEDAAEPGRRHRTACAVVGDTRLSLELLAEGVDAPASGREAGPTASTARAAWLATVLDHAAGQRRRWEDEVPLTSEGAAFSAASAMRVLADTVGGEPLLVLDAVTSTLPLLRFLTRTRRDTLFATASGSLGWGMGAALGVALAREERTLAVVGDGVVQFGVPALWTAARSHLPVTFVVVNNGRYQAVVSGLRQSGGAARQHDDYPLTDISGVDIAALAASFGIPSVVVDGASSLRDELRAHLALDETDGPRLIEIRVNDDLWA